ncbi:hypothetical protein QQS21_002973 [Conoideocrella luteorostrata]|uniref:SGNH hydrolase-type esterase domain-containing protein n=1 Tax=Conoideocrella luteorostrata TaxID=1105319 RepID=A0AAJ0G2L6_9HYPO|nr:hypothetical protein QQS21_002973 [Conoideocrella luteorostrata]
MIGQYQIQHGLKEFPDIFEPGRGPIGPNPSPDILHYTNSKPGQKVKPGTELRILGVGESITVGFLSDRNGGDGNGYRLKLRDDLPEDDVVFVGTQKYNGTMDDGYFVSDTSPFRATECQKTIPTIPVLQAAWNGKTTKFIADHIGPSLKQRPNIVLLHAGTNDMNPNSAISTEGNDPQGAANRLGDLIDQMIKECPDAVILAAMIINTCNLKQSDRTKHYQQLIPAVAAKRKDAGHHVVAVDFTTFQTSWLQDCIHPTNDGYKTFGDYWYDFITQIPKDWIKKPMEMLQHTTTDQVTTKTLTGTASTQWTEARAPVLETSNKEV